MPRARGPFPYYAAAAAVAPCLPRLLRVPHHDPPVEIPLPGIKISFLGQFADLLLQLSDIATRLALLLLAALAEAMAGRGVALAFFVGDFAGRLHVHGDLDGTGFGFERHDLVGGGVVVVVRVRVRLVVVGGGGGAGDGAVAGVRVRGVEGVVVGVVGGGVVGNTPGGGVGDAEEGGGGLRGWSHCLGGRRGAV